MNILALDLGKFNAICCFFNTRTATALILDRQHHARLSPHRAHQEPDPPRRHGSLWAQRLDRRLVSRTHAIAEACLFKEPQPADVTSTAASS